MTSHELDNIKAMINGLIYHYDNYKSYSDSLHQYKKGITADQVNENRKLTTKMRHEVVAYLNRMGQFHSFVKSIRLNGIVPNALGYIPTIVKYMPIRNKVTAHRAIDAPRREDDIDYLKLSDDPFHAGAGFYIDSKLVVQFSPRRNVVLTFNLLTEHHKILEESNSIVLALSDAIGS